MFNKQMLFNTKVTLQAIYMYLPSLRAITEKALNMKFREWLLSSGM
jgi:hypothetical protein